MLNRRSTKIIDAVLLLASAIAVLAIAWAESRLPAEGVSGRNFALIGPDNRTYTRASFPPMRYWCSISGSQRAGVPARRRSTRLRRLWMTLGPRAHAFAPSSSHSIHSVKSRRPPISICRRSAIALLACVDRRIRCERPPRNSGFRYSAPGIPRTPSTIRWSTHRRSSSWFHTRRILSSSSPTVPQKKSVRSWSVCLNPESGEFALQAHALSEHVKKSLCGYQIDNTEPQPVGGSLLVGAGWKQNAMRLPSSAFKAAGAEAPARDPSAIARAIMHSQ